jgi:hypothetical protein
VVELKSILGASLAGQERFHEAEPLLVGAYSRWNDVPAVQTESRRKIVGRLLALYQTWNRKDPHAGKAAEARRWLSVLNALGR